MSSEVGGRLSKDEIQLLLANHLKEKGYSIIAEQEAMDKRLARAVKLPLRFMIPDWCDLLAISRKIRPTRESYFVIKIIDDFLIQKGSKEIISLIRQIIRFQIYYSRRVARFRNVMFYLASDTSWAYSKLLDICKGIGIGIFLFSSEDRSFLLEQEPQHVDLHERIDIDARIAEFKTPLDRDITIGIENLHSTRVKAPIKVSTRNFGPIGEGQFAFAPFNIMIGPNKVGKSYFAAMIHSILTSF
ncbi:MAG: hypothetical protein ACFFGZ_02450 [Candidatus Thorarchaeota archaeon]